MHFIPIIFNDCTILIGFSELTLLNHLFGMFDDFINGLSLPDKSNKHARYER